MCNSYMTDVIPFINPQTGKVDEYERHYCQALLNAEYVMDGRPSTPEEYDSHQVYVTR